MVKCGYPKLASPEMGKVLNWFTIFRSRCVQQRASRYELLLGLLLKAVRGWAICPVSRHLAFYRQQVPQRLNYQPRFRSEGLDTQTVAGRCASVLLVFLITFQGYPDTLISAFHQAFSCFDVLHDITATISRITNGLKSSIAISRGTPATGRSKR